MDTDRPPSVSRWSKRTALPFCFWNSLGALAWGCGSPPPAIEANALSTEAMGVLRYMPLKNDTVYEYEVSSDAGEKGRMMMLVSRSSEERAVLNIAGRVQRLSVADSSIALDTGGYLLKAPLQEGATWRGQFGVAKVESLSREVETPSGKFRACLEVIEESQSPPKSATSIYCPEVGLVYLEIQGSVDGELGSVTSVLRSHGPRVSID